MKRNSRGWGYRTTSLGYIVYKPENSWKKFICIMGPTLIGVLWTLKRFIEDGSDFDWLPYAVSLPIIVIGGFYFFYPAQMYFNIKRQILMTGDFQIIWNSKSGFQKLVELSATLNSISFSINGKEYLIWEANDDEIISTFLVIRGFFEKLGFEVIVSEKTDLVLSTLSKMGRTAIIVQQ